MRTVAKIEPEWIISAAGNLLKYHYFEPHWSKKTGRVKAYAQISLFGLIIIAKQLTNYEQVNLVEAREIFIRDGLVTGNFGRQAPFYSTIWTKSPMLSVLKISYVAVIYWSMKKPCISFMIKNTGAYCQS